MNQSVNTPPVVSIPAPARPRRRWWKYLLVALLLMIGLPAAFYLYLKFSVAQATNDVVDQTTASDSRWRLEHIEADRKQYKDEENSALVVAKIARGWRGVNEYRDYQEIFGDLEPQYQLHPQQIDIIRQTFEPIPEVLAEARRLKELPGGRYPIKYSPDFISTIMTDQQHARRIFDLMQHDAMFRAQNGDPDLALESTMALLSAARSLGDEPLLISTLIRIAGVSMTVHSVERVLAQGFPTERPLAEMQRRLNEESKDLRRQWVNAVRGERAGHHELFQQMAAGRTSLAGLVGMGGQPGLTDRLVDQFPIFITRGYPEHLAYMNELVAAAQLPDQEILDRVKQTESTIRERAIFTRLLAPAMMKVSEAHLRGQSFVRTTEAALACERFRIEHKRWPESLDELVAAKKLDAVPPDPFSREPLRLRRLADGIVVYSVGRDGKDNQGDFKDRRWHEPDIDYGIRLWDPARRRQPARPIVIPAPQP